MSTDIPPISEAGARAVSTTAHAIAIGMSVIRSYLRAKKHHVWWDDRLAVMGAIVDVVYMLTLWFNALDSRYELDGIVYHNAWIFLFPCFFVIWVTRISVWLSLARIYPPRHNTRRLSFVLAAIFSALGVVLTVGVITGCPNTRWGIGFRKDLCITPQATARSSKYESFVMASGASNIICDSILVIVPAWLLSNVRQLPRKRKLVIVFLCCGSVLTLIFICVIFLTLFLAGPFNAARGGKDTLMDCLTHVSAAMSLISANLLVVGAATYRWIERWMTKRSVQATQRHFSALRHNASAEGITYNSDLTRITTLGLFSDGAGDLEDDAENTFNEETRPLFLSLGEGRRGDEYHELSDRRRTV